MFLRVITNPVLSLENFWAWAVPQVCINKASFFFYTHLFLFMVISTQGPFRALSPLPSTFSALPRRSEESPFLSAAILHCVISKLKLLESWRIWGTLTCRDVWVRWCFLTMGRWRRMNLAKRKCRVLPCASSLVEKTDFAAPSLERWHGREYMHSPPFNRPKSAYLSMNKKQPELKPNSNCIQA